MILYITSACIFLMTVTAAPISKLNTNDDQVALKFLKKYGYSDGSTDETLLTASDNDMVGSIMRMQSYYGLSPTGKLNKKTIKKMKAPRCGNSDEHIKQSQFTVGVLGEDGRDGTQGKWLKRELTYAFENRPVETNRMSYAIAMEAIRRAFGLWSDATLLTFKEQGNPFSSNLKIGFFSGTAKHHGTPFDCSFDGEESKEIAHAFYPKNGHIHFDDSKDFSYETSKGINLFWVAVHEIGHVLGLQHSSAGEGNAIMHPEYAKGDHKYLRLEKDDIKRIQALYGVRNTYASCRVENTEKNDKCGGDVSCLDRHNVDCKGSFLSRVQLMSKPGDQIGYNYRCCDRLPTLVCKERSVKYTGWKDYEKGDSRSLRKHQMDCGKESLITQFRLEWKADKKDIRYQYSCCETLDERVCVEQKMLWKDSGEGTNFYLDRLDISCSYMKALQSIKLEVDGLRWRYVFKCCDLKRNFD